MVMVVVAARHCSSRFDGNHAGEQGGGIHCFECALWAVHSTFEGNTATGDGGGMTVSSASTANINFCHFIDNSVLQVGESVVFAAMRCDEDSMIEMQDCNSTSNSATLGGSIYMSRSELDLRKCLFVGDTVPTGAIVYTLDAKVRARDSIFEDTTNNAGMLAVQAGSHTEFEAQDCYFIGWTGTNVVLADQTGVLHLDGCDFSESTASSMVNVQDGGTLAVVRNARLGTSNYQAINYGTDLETPLEAENSSVSIFGSNIAGCELSGCSDNEGCIEGDLGVYCYCYVSVVDTTSTCLGSSGTLTLTGPDSVVSTTYPDAPSTSLVLSWNDSEALGADSQDGAGEPGGGAGLWEIVWLDDPRSVAWVVVPSTGLAYPGENITISLNGEVSTYWNGESTTVFTAEAPHQEEVDPFATSINASFVYCNAGQYWVASETSCMMCADVALNPEGLSCDSEGTLLETLPLAEGYWRSTETSTNIRECFNDDACIGSEVSQRISSPNDYCDTGYMGPYCAVCMDGYTTGVSHTCHSCDGSYWAGMVVVMALTGVVLVVGVVIVLNDLVGNPALTDLSETHFSVMSRRIRTIPFHKLKIPFVVLQIITQYASITSIEFAPVFQTFLSTISVINLDLGWVLTSVCIIDVNFYGNLIAATVGPLMVLLVLAATYLYTW
ncbi:conserved unknown protein [Ectocarpus siliculosus]|uniref:Right handed beta helix domain-containing protein n=1 Tax=Ectocarpus siliculosus TaxID=2880 RepID=D8LRF7_ECTSI|nr:conserved unknown protein [Ectocarpus siliculosus]|eukprot:CBN75058.1 conserved unknown protein [Ectocarpus siliculosus]